MRSWLDGRGAGALDRGSLALSRGVPGGWSDAGGITVAIRSRPAGAPAPPRLAVAFGPLAPREASVRAGEPAPGVWELESQGGELGARMTVWVDAEADAECRLLEIASLSATPLEVEVTSAGEVVLLEAAADASHPVFSKLFIQTAWEAADVALVARRRPRGAHERFPALWHALDGPGAQAFETDRGRFVGRGRAGRLPRALEGDGALAGSAGNVLDPVLALRRTHRLEPGGTIAWRSAWVCSDDDAGARAVLRRLRSPGGFDASRAGAEHAERGRRRRGGLDAAALEAAQAFLVALRRRDPALRGPAPRPSDGPPARDAFAAAGIGGGERLVVADARTSAGRAGAHAALAVHAYARELGDAFSLLVLAAEPADFGVPAEGVAIRRAAELGDDRIATLGTHAAAWLGDPPAREVAPAIRAPARTDDPFAPEAAPPAPLPRDGLEGFNGIGGFRDDGATYEMHLVADPSGYPVLPPLPWTNVIAGPEFGTLVSETGAGFTWSGNSREHRLTPWSNDPVRDPHGEALYVRDEEDGRVWSPQPGPVPPGSSFVVRHRPGATEWITESRGLHHRTTVSVAPDLPVRFARVEFENRSDRARRLRVVGFATLVLGGLPDSRGPRTRCDDGLGAVLAWNPLHADRNGAVTWASAVAPEGAAVRVGNDRAAFLGDGGIARPAALAEGRPGAAEPRGDLAPAAIVEATIELPAGGRRAVTFLLGCEPDRDAVVRRLGSLRVPGAVDRAIASATAAWDELLDGLRIATPEPALDRMVNHWLPYQNLSCRLWGRSAFYQSGGAFGFRDQLQDASAFVWTRPDITREQIVRHAAHQFVEGDVLHWWHPPAGRGLRTRFADDLLWLPWIAAFHVAVTGDASVLEVEVPFLRAAALEPGEAERYLEPEPAGESASVYEHAARAVDRSLGTGERGMPLFGCGDWNDSMNRVGEDGRGESVWMAFFLHEVIRAFLPHARARGDDARIARWTAHQRQLEAALETTGWDGEWYRRGYYGDGTPIGSKQSDECRIDALAQAWSVISQAVPRARAEQAMRAMEHALVSETDGIVRLLAPPFEHTPRDPGYIKGYVAGVRENGGQYTHAALWVVRAMAELGWRDRAAPTLAMLSPVHHTGDPESVARYRTEPYVIAADVYGAPPHVGRGGWTWYTGSAGWMVRVAVESILGLRVEEGRRLRLAPCLPDAWPGAALDWRVPGGDVRLEIRYRNPSGSMATIRAARLDGTPVPLTGGALVVPIPEAPGTHRLEVEMGPAPPASEMPGRA